MTFARLLAKSSRSPDAPRGPESLPGHLVAVTRTASFMAEQWGQRYVTSLGLDHEFFDPRLRVALPRAAFLHDLGKANDHFQRMVRSGVPPPPQACWHEQLSVWLTLRFVALGSWLFAGCDDPLRQSILAAAVGHHLRLKDASEVALRAHSGNLRITLLTGHRDFAAALRAGAGLLGLSDPPDLVDVTVELLEPESFDDLMDVWIQDALTWWETATTDERRFVAALKALVLAADIAGSAVPRMRADPVAWTRDVLGRVCTHPGLDRVVRARLAGSSPRPFQDAVQRTSTRVTFVRAGCGSGKTAAAYLWAGRKGPGRKLFFCYPTTGTASQGFADYVPPNVADARLIHSRATVDLEDVLMNGHGDGQDRLDWLTRFASLAAWDAPITVCTVDTVLGLIQNNRPGLFSFPSIGNGAFVFDEIHQYDDRLFGALLRFLDAFRGVPTLLMTASLPRARLTALQEMIARLGERLQVVDGPADLEALKRYQVERVNLDTAWDRAEKALDTGERVLWVANTVDRAVRIARRAEDAGLNVLAYHSRYRYQDRRARHDAVVSAFAGERTGGSLAVTTQVCEVSLDLSADLLVTELAPIASIIQRLGRLNRRVSAEAEVRPALALVVEPATADPYEKAELVDAHAWLDLLGAGPVSQADLSEAFDRQFGDALLSPQWVRSAWLDGGLLAAPAPLREAGMTIPVIRQEDRVRLRGLPASRKSHEIIRLTIPMPLGPVQREIGSWPREGGALVAPAGRMAYSERFGGHWT